MSQNSLLKCPKDGLLIKDHPKCAGCGYLAGLHHELKEDDLKEYRDKKLCPLCVRQWEREGDVPFKTFVKEEKTDD